MVAPGRLPPWCSRRPQRCTALPASSHSLRCEWLDSTGTQGLGLSLASVDRGLHRPPHHADPTGPPARVGGRGQKGAVRGYLPIKHCVSYFPKDFHFTLVILFPIETVTL